MSLKSPQIGDTLSFDNPGYSLIIVKMIKAPKIQVKYLKVSDIVFLNFFHNGFVDIFQ